MLNQLHFKPISNLKKQRVVSSIKSLNGIGNQKKFYTSYSKLSEVKLITVGLASPERIKQWAEKTLPNGKIVGKVINANTLHHKTFKPQKGGLFCERIFGPLKDFSCGCGKLSSATKHKNELKNALLTSKSNDLLKEEGEKLGKKLVLRKFCPDCDVEYTWSVIRRYQLGYIQLVSPVTHVWYVKGNPSYLSILLDMKKRHLEYIAYCSETLTLENSIKKYIGTDIGVTPTEIFSSWEKFMNPKPTLENSKVLPLTNQISNESDQPFLLENLTKKEKNLVFKNQNEKKKNVENFKTTKKMLKRSLQIQKRKDVKPTKKTHWLDFYFSLAKKKKIEGLNDQISLMKGNQSFNQKNFKNSQLFFIKLASLYWKLLTFNKNQILSGDFAKTPVFSKDASKTIKLFLKNLPIPFYILLNLEFLLGKKNQSFSVDTIWKDIYKKILNRTIDKKRDILLKLVHSNNKIRSIKKRGFIKDDSILDFLSPFFFKKEYNPSLKELNLKRFQKHNSIYSLQSHSNFLWQKNLILKVFVIFNDSFFKKLDSNLESQQNQTFEIQRKELDIETSKLVSCFSKKPDSLEESVWLQSFSSLVNHSFLSISSGSLSILSLKMIRELVSNTLINQLLNESKIANQLIEKCAEKLVKPLIKNQIIFLKNLEFAEKNPKFKKIKVNFKGKLYEINQLETRDALKKIIYLIVKMTTKSSFKLSTQTKNTSDLWVSQNQFNFKHEHNSRLDTNLIKKGNSSLFMITKKFKKTSFDSIAKNYSGDSSSSLKLSSFTENFFLEINPFSINNTVQDFHFSQNFVKSNSLTNLNSLSNQFNKKLISSKKMQHEKTLISFFSRLKQSSIERGLTNQIYSLSHRQRWEVERDWHSFRLYNIPQSNSLDIPNPFYKDRLWGSEIQNFSSWSSSNIDPLNIGTEKKQKDKNSLIQRNTFLKKETSSLGTAFFSGPGILSQLLNEFNFSELKKMDSQNRILLYHLNKQIFKLKNQRNRLGLQKRNFMLNQTNSGVDFSHSSNTSLESFSAKLPNAKSSRVAKKELKESYKKRDLLIRRTKLVRKLFRKDSDPQSMILTVLPVLPPDLRPIVKIGGQIAASDLNRLYQRVIYRNDRLKKFLNDPATNNSYEMKYAQRLLQEAVDNLISNGKSGVTPEKDSRGRLLKSLSDILKGKQGRFRQYLLGKRVDYSGRSVIVVGPNLKLHECGIPKEMAFELYLPFLLKTILNQNLARTVVGAKTLIKKNPALGWELLREIMQSCPVLLNRAPTLHRLGIQAFQPKLVEGRAILLHPLVCSAFNADFDGDQMAVHIPITVEARAEAWKLMLSRNNLLSPATGEPLAIPSQDMVLGCYYLTTNCNEKNIKHQKGSGSYFKTFLDVVKSYENKRLDLHSIIWVQWNEWIENGNDNEEPLEIRLNSYGNYREIYSKSQKHYDKQNFFINQYVSTTPGKVLFNVMIQKSKRSNFSK